MSLRTRKITIWRSDQVGHKPACVKKKGDCTIDVAKKKTTSLISCVVTDQLCSYCTADLCLSFSPMQIGGFISSPVRKYRKSYCSHPGVGVGVAQNVNVFGSSFYESISLEVVDGSS